MFNFFQPFRTEVWLNLLLAYLAAALALWVAARITPYEKRSPKAATPTPYTLTSSLWFIFSSVFRGSNITPQVGPLFVLLASQAKLDLVFTDPLLGLLHAPRRRGLVDLRPRRLRDVRHHAEELHRGEL